MNDLILTHPEPGIASLRIHRPEVRNALKQSVRKQLAERFSVLGQVEGGEDTSLDAALMLERKAFHLLFASQDQREGMQAFFEQRKPGYTGH